MRKPFLIILALTLCLSLASSCGKIQRKSGTSAPPPAQSEEHDAPKDEEPAAEPEQTAEEPSAQTTSTGVELELLDGEKMISAELTNFYIFEPIPR